MNTHEHVDLLVIGWGKAGKTLAAEAAGQGQRVAIIEQDDERIGGTCINVACVPTKILIHEANQRRSTATSTASPSDFYETALERREKLTTAMRHKNLTMLAERDEVLVVSGRAEFVDAHTVEVTPSIPNKAQRNDTLRISATTVVINTGTRPAVPEMEGVQIGGRIHTSDTLQHTTPLPSSLIVVGGGYVGLEFASMFAGFGTRVTVLDRGERALKHEDDDVAAAAVEALHNRGVQVVQGASVTAVADHGATVEVTMQVDGATEVLTADAVLIALGRTPVTEHLGLDRAGIDTNKRGFIRVDEHLQTSAAGVYAVGDVNGGPQFTYVSLDDYRIVADHLYGAGRRSTADRVAIPHSMFLTPPLSSVGLTEREAREQGLDVRVAVKLMADIATAPRAAIEGDTGGIIKVVVNAITDEIVGATLMHVHSQEVINLVALAMRHGITASALRDSIYTHPSATEALNEVLGALSGG